MAKINKSIEVSFNKKINALSEVLTALYPFNYGKDLLSPNQITKNPVCTKSKPYHFTINNPELEKCRIRFFEDVPVFGTPAYALSLKEIEHLKLVDTLFLSYNNKIIKVNTKILLEKISSPELLTNKTYINVVNGYYFYIPAGAWTASYQSAVSYTVVFQGDIIYIPLDLLFTIGCIQMEATFDNKTKWINITDYENKRNKKVNVHFNDKICEATNKKYVEQWENFKCKLIPNERKKIYCVNISKKENKEYNSVAECAKALGVAPNRISMVLTGKKKSLTANNDKYTFGYKDPQSQPFQKNENDTNLLKEKIQLANTPRSDKGNKHNKNIIPLIIKEDNMEFIKDDYEKIIKIDFKKYFEENEIAELNKAIFVIEPELLVKEN